MATMKSMTRRQAGVDEAHYLDILSDDGSSWVVSLPPRLKDYQPELEALLGKVFADRRRRPENFLLAQQLSLNWCMSKCRQVGISIEESWS
jgi:hypothetical protein